MIISEKQIMLLMHIAYSHLANCAALEKFKAMEVVQNLLSEITSQQSEELKEIE